VILDCCYSGLALGRMSAGAGLADQAAVEGSFLLAAAAETRTALAPVGKTCTAFTGAVLEALRQGIPGAPALVDLGVLYRHLRVTMEARGLLFRRRGTATAVPRSRWDVTTRICLPRPMLRLRRVGMRGSVSGRIRARSVP
jgi:hypothetical protein